jgi:hypothetical protein
MARTGSGFLCWTPLRRKRGRPLVSTHVDIELHYYRIGAKSRLAVPKTPQIGQSRLG